MKIILDEDLQEVGKVTAKVSNEKVVKNQVKDVLTFNVSKGMLIVMLQDGLKGEHCNLILNKYSDLFKSSLVIGLSAIYKTKYSTPDGGAIEVDCEKPLPLRYTKSSHTSPAVEEFIAKNASQDFQNENQFNPTGGFIAAALMNAEMYGGAAISFKAIVEQHVITIESMQAFKPIVNELLGLNVDFEKINKMKQYKPVLKEMNAKKNGIFS